MATASLCTLRVGGEVFAFATGRIYEVLGERVVQTVPLSPEFVAGVISYRGEALMVLCLRTLLGMESGSKSANVIVLEDEHEGELFGLAVDSVDEILELDVEDFEENSTELGARRGVLFAGFYRTDGMVVTRLKPELLWPMRLMELFGDVR
jgi:purine-binding chemotaxis protein CheW